MGAAFGDYDPIKEQHIYETKWKNYNFDNAPKELCFFSDNDVAAYNKARKEWFDRKARVEAINDAQRAKKLKDHKANIQYSDH
jgi:hypothetical protein